MLGSELAWLAGHATRTMARATCAWPAGRHTELVVPNPPASIFQGHIAHTLNMSVMSILAMLRYQKDPQRPHRASLVPGRGESMEPYLLLMIETLHNKVILLMSQEDEDDNEEDEAWQSSAVYSAQSPPAEFIVNRDNHTLLRRHVARLAQIDLERLVAALYIPHPPSDLTGKGLQVYLAQNLLTSHKICVWLMCSLMLNSIHLPYSWQVERVRNPICPSALSS